ncbi:MAG: T9SS C-terminal target domain-containing protein [Chitinophagaceae bacterium]|nr:MAG: T9SS C-terminal target domain-containing protein [Chitinophagaceae bacterium]
MKTMKTLLSICIIMLVCVGYAKADEKIHNQLFVISGGEFGVPGNQVKLGVYYPYDNHFFYFDSLPGNFTGASQVVDYDGLNYLLATVGDELHLYDANTYEWLDSIHLAGINDIVFDEQSGFLYLSRSFPATDQEFVKLNFPDLTIADYYDVNMEASRILLTDSLVWLSAPGGWMNDTGLVLAFERFESSITLRESFDLGTDGDGIGFLFSYEDKVMAVASNSKNLIEIDLQDLQVDSHAVNTSSFSRGYGVKDNLLFVSYGGWSSEGIGTFNLDTKQPEDTAIYTGSVSKALYEPYSDKMYTLATDFSTFGYLKVWDSSFVMTDSIALWISPEALSADVRYVPQADFELPSGTIFANQDVLVQNTSENAVSFHWEIVPNTFAFENGTNENSLNPEIRFLEQGTYDITLTASIPGYSVEKIMESVEVDFSVSTEENLTSTPEFQFYPNPASDKLFLDNQFHTEVVFELYSIEGRQLEKRILEKGERVTISLNNFPKGAYLLRIQSDFKSENHSLIIN